MGTNGHWADKIVEEIGAPEHQEHVFRMSIWKASLDENKAEGVAAVCRLFCEQHAGETPWRIERSHRNLTVSFGNLAAAVHFKLSDIYDRFFAGQPA